MTEKPEIETVEKTAYLVKAEAYQTRSDLEELIATIESVSASVFLGDRQIANQVTGSLTQQIDSASKDITSDENIIISLDHNIEIRAKLLKHRTFLNSTLVEINSILFDIAEKRNEINQMRVAANLVTARLNAELESELKRIKNDQNFQSFEREFDDSLSLESFCIKNEHQNSQHLKALESIANASSDLRDKVTKVQAEAKTARDNIREGLPKSK
ncbi:hypothetical protein N9X93_02770 [Alphaproteobacteria bacterium]|nr:hypothetical protein [Alphaproteobacteria bacterium]